MTPPPKHLTIKKIITKQNQQISNMQELAKTYASDDGNTSNLSLVIILNYLYTNQSLDGALVLFLPLCL